MLDGACQAATLIAAAGADQQLLLDEFVWKYPKCVWFSSVSASNKYCVWNFYCVWKVLFSYNLKLDSPDYHKLTKIKDNIGQNSILQSNIPLQLHSLHS